MKSILGILIVLSSTTLVASPIIKSSAKAEEPSKNGYKTLDMSDFKKMELSSGPKSQFVSKSTCTTGGVTFNSTDAGYGTCLSNVDEAKNSRFSQGQRKENQPYNSVDFSMQQK